MTNVHFFQQFCHKTKQDADKCILFLLYFNCVLIFSAVSLNAATFSRSFATTCAGALFALISYYGWYKSLFFIPHDWKVTDEEGEFISRARSYFALLLSIGTPSLLFWIYNNLVVNRCQQFDI